MRQITALFLTAAALSACQGEGLGAQGSAGMVTEVAKGVFYMELPDAPGGLKGARVPLPTSVFDVRGVRGSYTVRALNDAFAPNDFRTAGVSLCQTWGRPLASISEPRRFGGLRSREIAADVRCG
ncbi:hypothetical protein [Jannaschia formosa]|uniref:hypothetical protein n=1 Tax=Jannaschia formosa TaxID=2259592 RepID=UPI000E1B549F|nr:hypothetical protein [Jannaschia formosa]TFL19212.1 hypothetical protein DR046_04595 [Jannaschia formosa]